MSRLIATIILRIVSASALSPYFTLSSLVTPSTSWATSSPKSRAHVVEGVRRVLDRVVEQRRDQRRLGHAELGEDRRHRERVGDVGLAALALLAAVHPLGGDVGALEQRQVGLGVVGPDRAEQRLEDRVARLAPGADPRQPGAHPAGRTDPAERLAGRRAERPRRPRGSVGDGAADVGAAASAVVGWTPARRRARSSASALITRSSATTSLLQPAPSGQSMSGSDGVQGGQRQPARAARPARNDSSMSTATPATSPPHASTSVRVAATVPPVASTSSTTRTRSPGRDRVLVHLEHRLAVLQRVGDLRASGPAACPALRTGTKPGAERERDRRGEDEAAGLDADDLVDRRSPVRRRRRRRRAPRTTAVSPSWSASSGEMSLNTTPGFGKSGTSRISRSRCRRVRPVARRSLAQPLPRCERGLRVGCGRPADVVSRHRTRRRRGAPRR